MQEFSEAYDPHDLESDEETTGCIKRVEVIQNGLSKVSKKHGGQIKWAVAAACIVGYAIYFGYAMRYEFGSESSIRLLWMTLLGVFIVMVMLIKDTAGDKIYEKIITPPVNFVEKHFTIFKV